MNLKKKTILICIIYCLTLVGCNSKIIKNIEVTDKQYIKVHEISDKKQIDNFSDFFNELSWKKDEKINNNGSETTLLIVHYENTDEEAKYAIYENSDDTSTIYNTNSKGKYVKLNKTKTKTLNEIIKK